MAHTCPWCNSHLESEAQLESHFLSCLKKDGYTIKKIAAAVAADKAKNTTTDFKEGGDDTIEVFSFSENKTMRMIRTKRILLLFKK